MICKDFHIVRVYLNRSGKRKLNLDDNADEMHKIINGWTEFKKEAIERFSGKTFAELHDKYLFNIYECGIALMCINSNIYMMDGGMYYTFFIPVSDTKAIEWFSDHLKTSNITHKVLKRIPLGWLSLDDRKEIGNRILRDPEEYAKNYISKNPHIAKALHGDK